MDNSTTYINLNLFEKHNLTTDLHGYEIFGYDDAVTKAKKAETIRRHIKWLQGHQEEAIRALEQMLNELEG